jgi:uncharacterized membrane protein
MSAVHHQPDGAAFDVVLLLHVACAVAGLVTTAAAAATASRLRRLLRASAPLPEPLRRYFRPGVNWAGRTVYGVPVFGFALVGMSQGDYALGDSWVLAGVVLFVAVALVAEGVLWPAERRLRTAVGGVASAAPIPRGTSVERDAESMARAAGAALVLLVAAMVVMVAQP